MAVEAQLDDLVRTFESLLSITSYGSNTNVPYELVVIDFEEGAAGKFGKDSLTEVGLTAISLSKGTNYAKTEFEAEKLIYNLYKKHYRVLEHGAHWFWRDLWCHFNPTKSEFAQSQWLTVNNVKAQIERDLNYLKKNRNGPPKKLILFAFSQHLELKILRELDINTYDHFESVIDIQKLSNFVVSNCSGQPSLSAMAHHFSITMNYSHNGLNDAVYEAIVLLNLVFKRAQHISNPITTNNHTQVLSQALDQARMAPRITGEALLPRKWPRGRRCDGCGSMKRSSANCTKLCVICDGRHASTDPAHHPTNVSK